MHVENMVNELTEVVKWFDSSRDKNKLASVFSGHIEKNGNEYSQMLKMELFNPRVMIVGRDGRDTLQIGSTKESVYIGIKIGTINAMSHSKEINDSFTIHSFSFETEFGESYRIKLVAA